MADIVGGLVIGLLLIYVWHFLSFGPMLYYWSTHVSAWYVIPISITAGIVLLTLHPEPVDYCPCFEDSACFIGSCVGLLCGASRTSHINSYKDFSIGPSIARYVVGVCAMLATRFVLKPLMWKILPWFYDVFHFHGRRFLPHLSRKNEVNVRETMKPYPSLIELRLSEQEEKNKKPPHDVDIPTKYIVYAAMTWMAADGAPMLFSLLNLL